MLSKQKYFTGKSIILLLRKAITSFILLLLSNGYLRQKNILLDNSLKIYLSQSLKNFLMIFKQKCFTGKTIILLLRKTISRFTFLLLYNGYFRQRIFSR